MTTSQLVKVIQAALKNEIKTIERIEFNDSSIFLRMDDKIYFITVQEHKPVDASVRTFNPQPKPEGKK